MPLRFARFWPVFLLLSFCGFRGLAGLLPPAALANPHFIEPAPDWSRQAELPLDEEMVSPWVAPPSGIATTEYLPPPPQLAMAGRARPPKRVRDGTVATLLPRDLVEYRRQPKRVRTLIWNALSLTQQGLGYKFGSHDPRRGGMDCSGTIHYILRRSGWDKAPRTSRDQYLWLREYGTLTSVDGREARHYNNRRLRPGDLLFWIHTYRTRRNPPITHVAIYLGTDRRTGKPVIVHAGGGRKYAGKARRGVTVVELEEPARRGFRGGKGSFVGFGTVPGAR
jgi:hypothetical protein